VLIQAQVARPAKVTLIWFASREEMEQGTLTWKQAMELLD